MKKYAVVGTLVAVALSMAACSSGGDKNTSSSGHTNNTTLSAVDQWKNNNGSDVQQFVDDLTTMQNDASSGASDATMSSDCSNVGFDAQTILNDGPFPDPVKGPQLTAAMTNVVSGAQACVNGIATGDVLLMQQAVNDFRSASNTLNSSVGA